MHDPRTAESPPIPSGYSNPFFSRTVSPPLELEIRFRALQKFIMSPTHELDKHRWSFLEVETN